MLWTKVQTVATCVLALGALGLGAVLARQTVGAGPLAGPAASGPARQTAPPKKAEKPPRVDEPAEKAEKPRAEKKRFTFVMREQPWDKVFEWYAERSGLGYVGSSKPAGTFTFIPPRPKRIYTLDEITDILNEGLLAKKYVLVRRTTTFSVLPADEKVDPVLVPRVKLADLKKRARTELVSVEVPLKSVRVKALSADVRKLLGPFGSLVVLEKGNRLIMQDTAGNLRRIARTVQDIEAREAEKERGSRKK
jgi:type II secretory pathway component GspD/PulD (secretin)